MFGKKPEPKPIQHVPLELMSFEELVTLSQKIQQLTAARLPDALADAEMRLQSLRSIAGFDASDTPAPKRKKRNAQKTYRNPDTGETYTKGKHPEWLKEAIKAGKTKDDFLVHSSE